MHYQTIQLIAFASFVLIATIACGKVDQESATAIPEDPDLDSSEAYVERGVVQLELGELVKAVGDFGEAIKMQPMNSNLYLQRGSTLAELLDLNSAIKDFSEAIRLDPSNVQAYLIRADTYVKFGHLSTAIKDYDEAIKIDPKNSSSLLGRASTYAKLGQFGPDDPRSDTCRPGPACEKSIEDYGLALKIDPSNFQAHYDRGVVNLKMLLYREAVRDFTKAI